MMSKSQRICIMCVKALRCARMWSYVVVIGDRGAHTCFGCTAGPMRCLKCGASLSFDGLEMVEIDHSVVLGGSVGKVETLCLLLFDTWSCNEHGPEMAVTGCSSSV